MIVVIQCAARKQGNAGHLHTSDGQNVIFVARPDDAPPRRDRVYARPDDIAESGKSWRTVLQEYNQKYNEAPHKNPFRLLPAWKLYKHRTYEILAHRCGLDRLHILSAGWGLIRADFLTPAYDITFQAQAEKFKRRRKHDQYQDFRMPPSETTEDIVFFGGKEYVDLFCKLTSGAKRPTRYVWFNSKEEPIAPGCILKRFHTRTRTNWHYECAQAFGCIADAWR